MDVSLCNGLISAGLVATLVAGPAQAAAPPPPVALQEGAAIVRGAGRVKADGSKEWRETKTADILVAGVTVQASAEQPLEMTLPDGVTITLESGAIAEWMPAAKLPSETNRWTRGYHLVLEQGELEVRMPDAPKGSHAFLVSTKAGTLTDWRGQLHVRVDQDSAAAAIYQGALVVGSNGQGFPVYDGAGIVMRRGVNPERTRAIPAPPQWVGNDVLGMVSGDALAPVELAWGAVAKATSYRVEIAADPTMVRVIERGTTSQSPYKTARPIAAGRYWAHVRAVGEAGIVGSWSPPRALHLVRYDVPQGAFVAKDGAIVLPDGASVALPGAEHLEVAFESVTSMAGRLPIPLYWAHLGRSVRLGEDSPMRIVHLRDPVTHAQAMIVLARRQLRANVELGPAKARWPLDPLHARIDVVDPSGRIDVANEPVEVETLLNLTPLDVPWDHRGATWTGRIAPHRIGDSAVVRVVVKDGRGNEIGRGFLELEAAPAAGSAGLSAR